MANVLATSRWLAKSSDNNPLEKFGDTNKFDKHTFCDKVNEWHRINMHTGKENELQMSLLRVSLT